MNKKGPLGRGLAALIEADEASEVREIDVERIEPNPYQPRKRFNQEKLDELVKSIKTQGIIQPIIVAKGSNNKYQIVVGERRWRAAKQLKMAKVKAIVKTMDRKEMMEWALIENIQREDLNPMEQAEAFKQLMGEFKYTQEELSEVVGRSRSGVANTLRLLRLAEDMKEALREGKITEGHGRALLSVESEKERAKLFKKMMQEKVTVRKAEKEGSKKREKDPNFLDLESRLSKNMKTKVSIQGRKKKGKIVIEYYSWEQLEGIIDRLEGEVSA
jgi:ParB family chromosome partitioning protein